MVSDALDARGIPLAAVRLMQPWLLTTMVALPECEVNRKGGGTSVLDVSLAERAQAGGKQVEGLETALEQIEAMASLPMADHVRGLVETIRLGDRTDDVFETMIDLYDKGETARIMPTLSVTLGEDDAAGADSYAAFEEKMIIARNGVMATRLPEHLAEGGAFVAVGALHLPGKDGVIEQLRRAGYAVTKVD